MHRERSLPVTQRQKSPRRGVQMERFVGVLAIRDHPDPVFTLIIALGIDGTGDLDVEPIVAVINLAAPYVDMADFRHVGAAVALLRRAALQIGEVPVSGPLSVAGQL